MSNEFDNNRDAAAQEYNRYRTIDSVTAPPEEELRTIPESDLDTVQPTVRDEDGIRSVVSEEESVNAQKDSVENQSAYMNELDTGTNATGQPAQYEVQEDTVLDEDALPDVPDADEFNGGETPEDPFVPSSYDQDAHGTDLRNGSIGEDSVDDADDFDRKR